VNPPDRYNISELAAQYAHHPDLRDIYVEGRQDKVFFEWFLSEMGISHGTVVYESKAVEVGAEVLAKHGISNGSERTRLIALSQELSSLLENGHEHLMFVVDADFDYILGSFVSCELLFYTDGASLESYFVSPCAIRKFFQLALRGFSLDAEAVILQVLPVLTQIFLIRAANERLGWHMSWLPFAGSCSADATGSLSFTRADFIRNYLGKNGRAASLQEFVTTYDELETRLGHDARQFMRGHDFAELLSIVIRRHLHHDQRNFRDANVIEAVLFTSLEARAIQVEPLFQNMANRMAP